MGTKVLGNINIALIFGILQFLTTFVLAYVYSRYSTRQARPARPRALNDEYDEGKRR